MHPPQPDHGLTSTYRAVRYPLLSAWGWMVLAMVLVTGIGIFSFNKYQDLKTHSARTALLRGISAEQKHLMTEGDELANDVGLLSALKDENSDALLTQLLAEKEKRSVCQLGVTNTSGVLLTRTRQPGSGENVFLTSPQGRALASGQDHISTVEISKITPSFLSITTSRNITAEGNFLGALFANCTIDEQYARHFAASWLPSGVDAVFYTHELGISQGSSISDPDVAAFVDTYLHADSPTIRDGLSGGVYELKSGKTIRIENVVFDGIEQSPGGVLLLVPVPKASFALPILVALFGLIVWRFALMLVIYKHKYRIRPRLIIAALVITLLVALAFASLASALRSKYLPSEVPSAPFAIYNSTLSFSPPSDVLTMPFSQRVNVVLDTGVERINAASVVVAYDPARIEVSDVVDTKSVCAVPLGNNLEQGSISFSCLAPNPGFKGKANLFSFLVRPLVAGSATLHFDENTQILANDGLGTNVLRLAQDSGYQIMNPQGPTSSVAFFSPSHPNSEKWYSSRAINLFWLTKPSTRYSYVVDQAPTTQPSTTTVSSLNRVTANVADDGTYFAHLRAFDDAGNDTTAHLKILVDKSAPAAITFAASQSVIHVGEVVRFQIAATDNLSGVQRQGYLSINGGLYLPVGQWVYIPFSKTGTNKLKIRVYDNAGNYSERLLTVSVIAAKN